MKLSCFIHLAFPVVLFICGCKEEDKDPVADPGPHETETIDNTLIQGGGVTSFQRIIGGKQFEWFSSVIQIDNGMYRCVGSKSRTGSSGMFFVQLDSLGQNRGISALYIDNYNQATCIDNTVEGGYIFSWTSSESGSASTGVPRGGGVFKKDQTGENEMSFDIDGFSIVCQSVKETTDGGYALTAVESDDNTGLFITTDAYLGQTHRKEFPDQLSRLSCDPTIDGGYILCGVGVEPSGPSHTIWFKKLDAGTNELWSDSLVLNGEADTYVRSIVQTSDGLVVCGHQLDADHVALGFVLKMDMTGNLSWQKEYSSEGIGIVNGIILTRQNQLVAIADAYSDQEIVYPNKQAHLFSLDEQSGGLNWHRTFVYGTIIAFNDVRQTADNGFVVVGESSCFGSINALIVKTDEFGN